MSERLSANSGSIGFVGLLTIVFIALKLTHQIDWPWIWVISPLWIATIVTAVILAVLFMILGMIKFFKK
jgi:hypothetical protein